MTIEVVTKVWNKVELSDDDVSTVKQYMAEHPEQMERYYTEEAAFCDAVYDLNLQGKIDLFGDDKDYETGLDVDDIRVLEWEE